MCWHQFSSHREHLFKMCFIHEKSQVDLETEIIARQTTYNLKFTQKLSNYREVDSKGGDQSDWWAKTGWVQHRSALVVTLTATSRLSSHCGPSISRETDRLPHHWPRLALDTSRQSAVPWILIHHTCWAFSWEETREIWRHKRLLRQQVLLPFQTVPPKQEKNEPKRSPNLTNVSFSLLSIFRKWAMQISWSSFTALWAGWPSFDRSSHCGETPTCAAWETIIAFPPCSATPRRATCNRWR